MKQPIFNYDNFKRIFEELEEMQDLVIKLNAQITVREAPVCKAAKPKKEKNDGNK